MVSSSMAWVIDQWAGSQGCGLVGNSLWGVDSGVTHVTMGSPILRRLANVKTPFLLEASVALRGVSTVAGRVLHKTRL